MNLYLDFSSVSKILPESCLLSGFPGEQQMYVFISLQLFRIV